LALDPTDDLVDGEDAHLGDGGAETLASLHQFRSFFKLALGDRAFAQHHFAEAVLTVAAGGEDELAAIEKELPLDAAEDELKLAGESRGINFIEQGEKLVMRFDFAGVQRERAALEPTGRRRDRFQVVILGEFLDEAMETGAILRTHVDELHAHAVTGATVADYSAGANFSTSDVEEKFDVGAGGKRVRDEEERSAYAQLLDIGGVALSGALPSHQQAFGRAIPRMAAAFVF